MRRGAALAALAFWACGGALPAAGPSPSPASSPGAFSPGPAVGQALPAFELPDQDGVPRALASFVGAKGLVVNFNRSVVW